VARWLRLPPFGLVWSDVDGIVGETWRPSSSMEKLLSGKRGQRGQEELGASLDGVALVAS